MNIVINKLMNFSNYFTVADPDFQRRGAGGGGGSHLDPQIREGGGRSPKKIFSALQASVWSKNKGGGGAGPPGPSPGSATALSIYNS